MRTLVIFIWTLTIGVAAMVVSRHACADVHPELRGPLTYDEQVYRYMRVEQRRRIGAVHPHGRARLPLRQVRAGALHGAARGGSVRATEATQSVMQELLTGLQWAFSGALTLFVVIYLIAMFGDD
jgi:hypothetical protein